MSNVIQPPESVETGLGNLEPLIRHLREHPFSVPEDTADLATRFGLAEEFVEDVARALARPVRKRSVLEDLWTAGKRSVSEAFGSVWRQVSQLFCRVTERPLVFIFITGVLAVALTYGLSRQIDRFRQGPTGLDIALLAILSATLIVIFVSHIACYARHGRVRVPIYGAVMALLVLSGALAGTMLATGAMQQMQSLALVIIAAGVAGTILAVMYGSLGVAAALAGGLYRIRQASRQEGRKSRQELLQRLFEVESRLRRSTEWAPARSRSRASAMLHRFRTSDSFFLISFGLGVAVGLVEVLVMGSFSPPPVETAGGQTIAVAILGLVLFLLNAVVYSIIGYAGGRVGRSILALFCAFVGSVVASLVPYGTFGPDAVWSMIVNWQWVVPMGVLFFLGVLTGVGAFIEQQTHEDRKMQADDPALLLAELVRIQWRLNPVAQATCVMVVDVARSTAMKADADPLKVEFSFREYQKLIETITSSHGGEVLSTAGDGAVVAFNSCNEALAAAKEIHSEMSRFNTRVNRLESPFRLRIGLHTGRTTAQIAEVQFNELIDIAAHVEAHAPVGGIAVTGPVAKLLPDEPMAALKEEVDGHPVSIVLNPTMGA